MNIRNIFGRKNKILLAELVRTDFKLRYESSTLGYIWSILNPLLLFAILYLVFDLFLGVGRKIEHFPVYLLTGIVLWRFFTETTTNGLKSITKRGTLIRKINFPKYIIVISGTISSLINLGINLVVIFIFMVINGVPFTAEALLIIPLILELYILAVGIAFLLSAMNVFLRDIGYLWEVVIQAAFYATPIIYPINLVVEKSKIGAELIMITNPVAQVIQDVRHVLITHDSLTVYQITSGKIWFLAPYVASLVMLIIGGLYFRAKSSKFAEHV